LLKRGALPPEWVSKTKIAVKPFTSANILTDLTRVNSIKGVSLRIRAAVRGVQGM
jgi:hypothetical protein